MNKILFFLSARWFGEACLELYIYRITPEGKEQVYLTPRSRDDPFYSLMLHVPGVRKIPNESDAEHYQRAVSETPFDLQSSCVEYVASTTLKTKRGTEFADIRRIHIRYSIDDASFYNVNDLPENIIEHHATIIEIAKLKG